MTHRSFSAAHSQRSAVHGDGTGYQPGVCNIGPAEIARRRRIGHIGTIATVALLAVLVAVHAPPLARFIIAAPAAAAAGGYVQALFRFCVAFGSAGVFNFGAHGTTQRIEDAEALRRDWLRVLELSLAIGAIATGTGALAVALPF